MSSSSTKNTSAKSANPPSNSSFSAAINTSFFSPDFFSRGSSATLLTDTKLLEETRLEKLLVDDFEVNKESTQEHKEQNKRVRVKPNPTNLKNLKNKQIPHVVVKKKTNPFVVTQKANDTQSIKKLMQGNTKTIENKEKRPTIATKVSTPKVTVTQTKVTTSKKKSTKKNEEQISSKHVTPEVVTLKVVTPEKVTPEKVTHNTQEVSEQKESNQQLEKQQLEKQQLENAMGAFAKDYIKDHQEQDEHIKKDVKNPLEKTLENLKKEAEQSELEYDSDSIVLNADIFARLANKMQSHKEQAAFEDAILANALEPSSLTQAFQNEEGIFIPQSLKSMRTSKRKNKAWKEALQGITITADNFTATPLRDIDFSDVNELVKNTIQTKPLHTETTLAPTLNTDSGACTDFDSDTQSGKSVDYFMHASQNEGVRARITPDVPFTTDSNQNDSAPVLLDSFPVSSIDPLLDNFSLDNSFQDTFLIDRMLKVKTVYATSFENNEEENNEDKIIKTSFFALYDKTDIALEDTLIWDSVHDTFEAPYHVFNPTDTKTITENYGSVKEEESVFLNSALVESHKTPTVDELCLSSPELRDILNHDAYFNDPISCTQNKAIFEDFNINSDLIDLTGSLGTNYTFEVLYQDQGFLICIRNEKAKFIQCLPVALANFSSLEKEDCFQNSHTLHACLCDMQKKIQNFQNSPHSILPSSIKKGREWFTQNVRFEPYDTFD